VVGGGYIGVEFASVFVRLGSEVTLVNRIDTILRTFDEDMRTGVQTALAERGIRFRLERMLINIEKTADGLRATLNDGDTIECDQVLIATGRAPNTAGLGLGEAGVTLGAKGEVRVDPYSQTNIPSIYAVGDVTDRVALTPVAIREGQAFADTVFGNKKTRVDYATIPTAVFTTPEIGTVGLTEQEAKATHNRVDVYAAAFRPMKTAFSGRADQTIMKIIVDADTDVVLGVHILGEDAGELAQVLGIAVKMSVTKAEFDATVALHPTSAEELVTMRTPRIRHERMADEPTGPGMADAC
jgi:glutathione reductase (NADPH)